MAVVVLVGEAVDLLVVVGLGFVVVAPAVVVAAVDVVESVVDADVVHVELLLAVVVPVVVEAVVDADVVAVALHLLSSSGNRSFSGCSSHFSVFLSSLPLSVATLSSFFSS